MSTGLATAKTAARRMTSITTIEDLSSEVFYEIFDYFHAFELCQAFACLNARFERLLRSSWCLLKVNDERVSDSELAHYCRQWVIPDKGRLLSLHLNSQTSIDTCFKLLNIDASFHQLQSLDLRQIRLSQALTLLPRLTSLPHLFSLTIQLDGNCSNAGSIYELVVRLPHLRYHHLLFASIRLLHTYAELAVQEKNVHFSPIEHLWVDHVISLNGLLALLYYTPRLRRLTCDSLSQSPNSNRLETLSSLTELTEVSIRMYDLPFDELEALVRKLPRQVRQFRFQSYVNLTYLDPDRWQTLIEKYMPQLTVFTFEDLLASPQQHTDHMPVIYFTSPFWVERQWVLQLRLSSDSIAYCVQPRKPMWFDSLTTIEPFVALHVLLDQHPLSIDFLAPILASMPVTYLNVDCTELDLTVFTGLLCQLQTPAALRVSFIVDKLPYRFCQKHALVIQEASHRNTITKVQLAGKIGIEEITFIINLCPRMTYLALDSVDKANALPLFRLISAKRDAGCVAQLRKLCYSVGELNSDTATTLRRAIDAEAQLESITIDRFDGSVEIVW